MASAPGTGLEQPLRVARRYLAIVDRLLPGRVEGAYVVGSAALGAFRDGQSDVDLVVVLDRPPTERELRRLRAAHVTSGAASVAGMVRRGRFTPSDTANAVFVAAGELALPVTEIRPVASQVGGHFSVGKAFDVNPVVWHTLTTKGIAVRGRPPSELALDPQPALLREWNRQNLRGYWEPWARALLARGERRFGLRPRWTTAWGVLGAPRLHHTIVTGEVISKEAAGEYALREFGDRWQPIIAEALAYWRGQPPDPRFRDRRRRRQETGEFVLEVVASADRK